MPNTFFALADHVTKEEFYQGQTTQAPCEGDAVAIAGDVYRVIDRCWRTAYDVMGEEESRCRNFVDNDLACVTLYVVRVAQTTEEPDAS